MEHAKNTVSWNRKLQKLWKIIQNFSHYSRKFNLGCSTYLMRIQLSLLAYLLNEFGSQESVSGWGMLCKTCSGTSSPITIMWWGRPSDPNGGRGGRRKPRKYEFLALDFDRNPPYFSEPLPRPVGALRILQASFQARESIEQSNINLEMTELKNRFVRFSPWIFRFGPTSPPGRGRGKGGHQFFSKYTSVRVCGPNMSS